MGNKYASIYSHLPSYIENRLRQIIHSSISGQTYRSDYIMFFRADDIGIPNSSFSRMINMFVSHRISINLAVVPAWITETRWNALMKEVKKGSDHLFCFHQHGWRHVSHEQNGRKQEFGDVRSLSDIKMDLLKGKNRLKRILGGFFSPFFTPPWNRCSGTTIDVLKETGYHGLSRTKDAKPPVRNGLPEFPVHVDLHTRKEREADIGWRNLFGELEKGLKEKRCGIMIHHQRMNENAFDFLNIFLRCIREREEIRCMTFSDLNRKGDP